MEAESERCHATTKAGDQCRNKAIAGTHFCRVHAALAVEVEAERAQVHAVADELNKIAEDLKKERPEYTPPPFSASALRKVLKENVHILASYMPSQTAKDLIHNLEGTRKEDLLDPETWKGLWYILNFTLQTQSKAALEEVGRRLAFVPGMDMMVQFGTSVIDSPGDLLDVETWKGAATILNATVMANASSLKRKVMGTKDAG
jgi:hypothetical protein